MKKERRKGPRLLIVLLQSFNSSSYVPWTRLHNLQQVEFLSRIQRPTASFILQVSAWWKSLLLRQGKCHDYFSLSRLDKCTFIAKQTQSWRAKSRAANKSSRFVFLCPKMIPIVFWTLSLLVAESSFTVVLNVRRVVTAATSTLIPPTCISSAALIVKIIMKMTIICF